MGLTRETVLEALRRVPYPGFSRDIVSLGVVREVRVEGGSVQLLLEVPPAQAGVLPPIEQSARAVLGEVPGVERIEVRRAPGKGGSDPLQMAGAKPSVAAAAGGLDAGLIPGVRHTVAVASGKGGVGKSTVAVNLAVGLSRLGARVGLLDADIYGPSVPLMTGVQEPPRLTPERKILPFERHGIRLMSLGFLVEPDSAVIWRGPMVMKAIEQLLRDVVWGELDYLVVDMPPGTGDAQLTLSQRVRLAGAVIVTTPQDVALADAIKGVAMFRKVGVPVLGLVENMSYYRCPECSHRAEIFGHGGGRREAERLGVPCIGEIPLDPEIRVGSDAGEPIVQSAPESPLAAAFEAIALRVRDRLEVDPAAEPADGGSIFDRFKKVLGGRDGGSDSA